MITELNLQVGSEAFLNELYTRSPQLFASAFELVRHVARYYLRATLCNIDALQWQSASDWCHLPVAQWVNGQETAQRG